MLNNIAYIFVWNGLIPILIGYLFTMFLRKEDRDNLALNFVIGFIIMLGIFQPITLFSIYLKLSLTLLSSIVMVVWIGLGVLSLILNGRRLLGVVKRCPVAIRSFHIFLAGAMILVFLQAYVYVAYEHIDDDDAFFVATATTAVENDNLYVRSPYSGVLYKNPPDRYILSPFSIYYAVLSKLSNMHVAVYAHLYLPIILLLLVYLIYYLWGRQLFNNNKSVGIFLCLISVLNLFGNYSEFTTQSFLLLRLWQGKAILAAGVIPFILYLCYRISKEEKAGILWLVLLFVTSCASHISSMGIFLAPLAIGCWALAEAIQKRKIKRIGLYLLCCLPCMACGVIYLVIS